MRTLDDPYFEEGYHYDAVINDLRQKEKTETFQAGSIVIDP